MRNLKDILKESILDDIGTQIKKGDKLFKDEIKAFLKENYKGSFKISRKPNSDGKYEVSSTKDIKVKNTNITSFTNGIFVWSDVSGDFIVRHCRSLTSLDGAPKKVGGVFDCFNCYSLKSLEGAPKEVGGKFDCSSCDSLKSLEGAPKKIGGDFNCCLCYSLTSLKGAPEKVEGYFACNGCKSLESLEGAPKEVGGKFYCGDCKVKFTEDDVKKISNVKGKIVC